VLPGEIIIKTTLSTPSAPA